MPLRSVSKFKELLKASSVARGGAGGGYSPPHWPADQNAE